jgi:hypothetical protein
MTERIYISEIQSELQYKDRRSVRRWCRNNNVRVLSDVGSNKQYALRSEYENARFKNYPIRPEVFNSSMAYFPKSSKVEKENEYIPLGRIEENFLNRLLNF